MRGWKEIVKGRQKTAGTSAKAEGQVCVDCVEDHALVEWISRSEQTGRCSYCRETGTVRLVAELVQFVREGLESEWGSLEEEPEGNFLSQAVDTQALLVLIDETVTKVAALEADLVRALPHRTWHRRNPWQVELAERETAWDHFQEELHHERRFFLHLSEKDERTQHRIGYAHLMAQVNEGVTSCNILRRLTRGARIHRVRLSNSGAEFRRASELGPPKFEDDVQPDRASQQGRPMMHGAFDPKGALKNTFEARFEHVVASLATFRTTRELVLLDLTKLPDTPSLFDAKHRGERPYLEFLRHYAEDMAKPIRRDKVEHVDYVATQVVTDYLRNHLVDCNGLPIDGIVHPNERTPDSPTVVLFVRNRDCSDKPRKGVTLFLEKVSHRSLAPRGALVDVTS